MSWRFMAESMLFIRFRGFVLYWKLSIQDINQIQFHGTTFSTTISWEMKVNVVAKNNRVKWLTLSIIWISLSPPFLDTFLWNVRQVIVLTFTNIRYRMHVYWWLPKYNITYCVCVTSCCKVGGMLDTVYEWFWWDKIWLPVNLTWADLEDREDRVYAKASHLYVTIPYTFAFLLIRYLFER